MILGIIIIFIVLVDIWFILALLQRRREYYDVVNMFRMDRLRRIARTHPEVRDLAFMNQVDYEFDRKCKMLWESLYCHRPWSWFAPSQVTVNSLTTTEEFP